MHKQIVLFVNEYSLQLLVLISEVVALHCYAVDVSLPLQLELFQVLLVACFENPFLVLDDLADRELLLELVLLLHLVGVLLRRLVFVQKNVDKFLVLGDTVLELGVHGRRHSVLRDLSAVEIVREPQCWWTPRIILLRPRDP